MTNFINLWLTEELRSFIDQNCGDGSLYSTHSEFVKALILREKAQQESNQIHIAIVEGYQDAIAGRTFPFRGDLKGLLMQTKK